VKRLIVNADDFGRTRGINAGVLEAHLFGIVTSSTVMVLEPAAEEGVAEVRQRAPRLALGLHFAITGGGLPASSPSRVPTLVEAGRFRRFPRDIPDDLSEDDVERELDAQIFLFEKMAGAAPTHLDTHHHAGLHPAVRAVVARAARTLGIPARGSDTAARDALRAAGVRTPDRFVDGFYGAGATAENLRAILLALEAGTTELMCHPGHLDERLVSGSSYAAERERELAILCDPEVRTVIADERIRLASYSEL
jgi:chitin disaccharide deacetylase